MSASAAPARIEPAPAGGPPPCAPPRPPAPSLPVAQAPPAASPPPRLCQWPTRPPRGRARPSTVSRARVQALSWLRRRLLPRLLRRRRTRLVPGCLNVPSRPTTKRTGLRPRPPRDRRAITRTLPTPLYVTSTLTWPVRRAERSLLEMSLAVGTARC